MKRSTRTTSSSYYVYQSLVLANRELLLYDIYIIYFYVPKTNEMGCLSVARDSLSILRVNGKMQKGFNYFLDHVYVYL